MPSLKYATGLILDPEGHQRTSFARLAARLNLSANTPDDVDLEHNCPAVMNQGRSSACTGHAPSCALFTSAGWLGFVPSQDAIYKNGRAIDRDSWNGTFAPLTDDGAMPNQVFRAINEYGLKPMGTPVRGRYSDVHEDTVNEEPTLTDLLAEARNIVVGDYGIKGTPESRRQQARVALASGKAICAAIAGGSDMFQNYSGGVLGQLNAPLDHYVCIIGYETRDDGSTIWKIRNSWGEDWGEKGNCWIDDNAFAELSNLIVVDVRRVS